MRKFAVFDIDGTLIRWQLYHILVDRLAKTNKLGPGVYDHIKEARMRWKKRESADSYHAYEMEIVKGFESALDRLTTQEFDEIIDSIIDEYKDQVYIYTRDLLKNLKDQGYFLLAISGSHHELIEKIAKYYQFDDYKGSVYQRNEDSTGFNGKKYIASSNKESALKEMIKQHNLSLTDSYGIGDSKTDIPILKTVDNPIAFNPNRMLYETARTNNWKIVIERKDMIYELQPSTNSTYTLV
jgi:HAD superfamily hydrolase (TIGR01490 family)